MSKRLAPAGTIVPLCPTSPFVEPVMAALVVLGLLLPSVQVWAQPTATVPRAGWRVGGTPSGLARLGSVLFIGGAFRGVAPEANASGNMLLVDGVTGARRPGFAEIVGSVTAIEPDGAGGWYVGGNFLDVVDGPSVHPRFRLAHVRADGTLDLAWAPTADGGQVRVLKRVPGVGVFVGGEFTALSGTPRSRVGLLDATTGAVLPWTYEVGGTNAQVRTLVHDGNTVIVGGNFATVNGLARPNLATMSAVATGQVGPDFQVTGPVDVVAVSTAGTIYLGGTFGGVLGQPRSALARVVHPAGQLTLTLDTWNPGANGVVRAFAFAGGQVFVGGEFLAIGGQSRAYLARLDAGTGAVAPFPSTFGAVNTLASAGDTLYVGGPFTYVGVGVGDHTRNGAAAFSIATGAILPWNPGPAGPVQVMAASGSNVAIGGQLTGYGAASVDTLAALDLQTGAVLPWDPDPYGGGVDELLLHGNTLFVAGSFAGFVWPSPAARAGLAAIDAVTGVPRPWTPNPNGALTGLAADGTYLYVGGSFTTIAGQPRSGLARFRLSDLTLDPTFAPSVTSGSGTIQDLVVAGTTLYVGGGLMSVNGGALSRVAAIDTTTGAPIAGFSTNPSAPVNRMDYHAGFLYLAGSFQQVDGQPRSLVAKVDGLTGALQPWTAGPFALDSAGAAAGFPLAANDIDAGDGTVLVSGAFSTVAGQMRLGLAQVDAATGALTSWAPNLGSGPSGGFGGPILSAADVTVVGGARLQLSDELLNGLALFVEPAGQLPVPPTGLAATIVGGQVTLGWRPAPIGLPAAAYVLEAGSGRGLANIARVNVGAATTFSIGNVPRGTYYVRVRAVTAFGTSAATPELAVTVGSATCTAPPEAPPEVWAGTLAGGQVYISWLTPSAAPPSSYIIEAGSASGASNLGQISTVSSTHVVPGVPPGVYYLRVRSRNACGISAPSAEVVLSVGGAVAPPSPPSGLTGSVSGGTVTLQWLPSSSSPVGGYRVEAGTSYGASNIAAIDVGGTTFATSNVPRGVYYVRVRAIGPGGVGMPSNEFVLVVP